MDCHSHKIYNLTSADKDNNQIYITQGGTKIQRIGELIIKKEGWIISRLIETVPEPENKTIAKNITRSKKKVWVYKETSEFLDNIWKKYENKLNINYGYNDYDFLLKATTPEDTTTQFCRENECTIGNLVIDAIRIKTESDICLINSGGIRNGFEKGNFTRRQLIEVMPYFVEIVVKEVYGKDILEIDIVMLPSAYARDFRKFLELNLMLI